MHGLPLVLASFFNSSSSGQQQQLLSLSGQGILNQHCELCLGSLRIPASFTLEQWCSACLSSTTKSGLILPGPNSLPCSGLFPGCALSGDSGPDVVLLQAASVRERSRRERGLLPQRACIWCGKTSGTGTTVPKAKVWNVPCGPTYRQAW